MREGGRKDEKRKREGREKRRDVVCIAVEELTKEVTRHNIAWYCSASIKSG